jgi:hypothetical protein
MAHFSSVKAGDDLRAATLLDEAPLAEVGGPAVHPVTGREPEVGEGGLEVLGQAGHRRRELAPVPAHDLGGHGAPRLERRGVPDGPQVGEDLVGGLGGELGADVAMRWYQHRTPRGPGPSRLLRAEVDPCKSYDLQRPPGDGASAAALSLLDSARVDGEGIDSFCLDPATYMTPDHDESLNVMKRGLR